MLKNFFFSTLFFKFYKIIKKIINLLYKNLKKNN